MSTSEMRERLITYLAGAEDKKVKALYTLLEDEINDTSNFSLSDEQKNILDEEREKYLNGEEKSYSWEQVKKIITGKALLNVQSGDKGHCNLNSFRNFSIL